jgi:Methylase involved in ubiquinone/menaquinone biosynthesis
MSAEEALGTAGVARRAVGRAESERASRAWWDADADDYLAEHGRDIGDADFVWCPEGLREDDAHLLGDVAGRRVLEVGCGSAPCARWLRNAGARPVGLDVSGAMLRRAAALGVSTGVPVPLVQAGAERLPFADASFDLACSAFGAVPFVAEPERVMREVARVLRPGGRWVFAVNHPMRWMFSDDPAPRADRRAVLLRPDALRRGGRLRRRHLRGAPPHPRRPRPRRRRRRAGARRRGGAGVAGGPGAGVGPVVPSARRPVPRHGDLLLPPPRLIEMPGMQVTWRQVTRWRWRRQLLVEPAPDVVTAARALGGLHAQVPSCTALIAGVRTAGRPALDAALWTDRTLVRTWAMRGTLHVLPATRRRPRRCPPGGARC